MRWVQSFSDRFIILSRAHSGKHSVSPKKRIEIENGVAKFLGQIERRLRNKDIEENYICHEDETHFIFNLDNGRTLGFAGESKVKCADAISGSEEMTMVFQITGFRDASISLPLMIFINNDRSYPIRGLLDEISGVSYRIGPKGWMYRISMTKWLEEHRVIGPLPNQRTRVMFFDNFSVSTPIKSSNAAAEKIRNKIELFPPNATDLLQSCDSFIIQKIKCVWQ